MKRPVLLLVLILGTLPVLAQEYGRTSGGEIDLITKQTGKLSGSLSASTSKTFDLNLGGTLIKDRVWFFASAERSKPMFATTTELPSSFNAGNVKMNAQIGDRQTVTATGATMGSSIPSTFLSLHYTGIISPNSFFTANFSEIKRTN